MPSFALQLQNSIAAGLFDDIVFNGYLGFRLWIKQLSDLDATEQDVVPTFSDEGLDLKDLSIPISRMQRRTISCQSIPSRSLTCRCRTGINIRTCRTMMVLADMLPTLTCPLVNDIGGEIPNTLPSSKSNPYALHDGDPDVTRISPLSPIEDLRYILGNIYEMFTGRAYASLHEELNLNTAIDMLEMSGTSVTLERVENRNRLIRHLF